MEHRKKIFQLLFLIGFIFFGLTQLGYADELILWNKLGSFDEIIQSEVGPDGELVGEVLYETGQYNNGFRSAIRTGDPNIPDNYIRFDMVLPSQGTVEFWYKPDWNNSSVGHVINMIQYGVPADGGINTVFQIHYNDWQNRLTSWARDINSGFASNYFIPSTQPGWIVGTPFHVAFTWDGSLNDNKVKFYLNDEEIGTYEESGIPPLFQWAFTETPYLYVGCRMYSGGWNNHHWEPNIDAVIDNIKVWDYAKTDFSDRFNEGTVVSVSIEPAEVVEAGAQWKLTTGPDTDWHDSGESLYDIPAGTYTVKFKNVVGWDKPANQSLAVVEGEVSSTSGKYELLAKSSVSTTILPPAAIAAGAQWKLTTGPDTVWHESGDVLNDIPVGSYIVKFKKIVGWERPANQTVEVIEGVIAEASGTYILLPVSTASCIIDPPEAVSDGAQWKLTSGPDTAWHESGEAVADIPVGPYTIRFKNITAWSRPDEQTIDVVEGDTAQGYGEYTLLPLSSVTCTLEPSEAVFDGAQWKLTTGVDTSWQESGDTLNNIPIGDYTVKFKEIYGWTEPENQEIELVEGSTASTSGTYTEITEKGAVNVTIDPQGAVDARAQWKLTSGPDTAWHISGKTISDLSIGSYVVKFKNIYGWLDPANQTISITEGNTTATTGTYTEITQKGSVNIAIEPQGAVDAGAQWKLTTGPDTAWHNTGDTISDLCIGIYSVKFKNIYGWTTPENQNIEVVEGSTASAIGTYTQITEKGSVRVTIDPPEAVADGAQWKLTNGPDTAWHISGDVISDLCIGDYIVKFKNIYGWNKPGNQSITVTENTLTNTTGLYEAITQFGAISVTIEPQEAIDDGAQWRMTFGSDTSWHESGDVISNVPIGSYTIKFRNIADWINPDNQDIQVVEGSTASITGTYLVLFDFPVAGNFNPTNFINAIPAWGCDPQGENCEGGINWKTVPANNPQSSDPTALKFSIYFPPNPYMDPNTTEPVQTGMNYTTPFPWNPIDLTGATNLTFWAKGEDGGEVVYFGMGGVNLSGPDSHSVDTEDFVLTQEWQKFTIDLTGADLSSINGGFRWVGTYQVPYSGYVGLVGTIYINDAVYKNYE